MILQNLTISRKLTDSKELITRTDLARDLKNLKAKPLLGRSQENRTGVFHGGSIRRIRRVQIEVVTGTLNHQDGNIFVRVGLLRDPNLRPNIIASVRE
jgi:hypothetical protein